MVLYFLTVISKLQKKAGSPAHPTATPAAKETTEPSTERKSQCQGLECVMLLACIILSVCVDRKPQKNPKTGGLVGFPEDLKTLSSSTPETLIPYHALNYIASEGDEENVPLFLLRCFLEHWEMSRKSSTSRKLRNLLLHRPGPRLASKEL